MASLSLPSTIGGRYSLNAKLGTGGMGTVFQGTDTVSGQAVAIKHLSHEVVEKDLQLLERFRREGEALRRLNHPNIVKVLDTIEESGHHYIIMEYSPGGSLAQLMERSKPYLPLNQALEIALDLSDALVRAHRLNIIHRDIKPENVLLAEDGTPRLADFGIASLSDMPHITSKHDLVGTLVYISPETFRDEEPDRRSDIWSFGVLMYQMLTGQVPFKGKNLADIMMAILDDPPPDLETLRPDLPIAVIDLIYRMLEKDRQQRIPTMRLVGAELEMLLRGRSTSAERQPDLGQSDTDHDFGLTTEAGFDTTIRLIKRAGLHNLPSPSTPFIGREDELRQLNQMIQDTKTRLITIVGPGGMGKTRLAQEAGMSLLEHFRNGVFFVGLAALTSPDLIVSTIAETLKVQFLESVDSKKQLLDYLREKQMLLILDNFEHLVQEASLVTEILATAPWVKIIVTSRERLYISSETLVSIQGMEFPDVPSLENLMTYSATKLFILTARRVKPSFEPSEDDGRYIVEICRIVDGMPLAILLAASWVQVFTPQEIVGEIRKNLGFLESDARDLPERHRSIRGVFNYSWNLLSTEEQTVLKNLLVFRGGFTREAAQAITGASLRTLMALVNKSLLLRSPAGRYEFHELLSQYTTEKLIATDHEPMRAVHGRYYGSFVSDQLPRLHGNEDKIALLTIESELENIRAAWKWAISEKEIDIIDRLAYGLNDFYTRRVRFPEAEALFGEAAEALKAPASEINDEYRRVLGNLYAVHGSFCALIGNNRFAKEQLTTSLSYLLPQHKRELGFAKNEMAKVASFLGNIEEALSIWEESVALYRQTDDVWGTASALHNYGWGQFNAGYTKKADVSFRESLTFYERFGADSAGKAYSLQGLGIAAYKVGNYDESSKLLTEAMRLSQTAGDLRVQLNVVGNLANLARVEGNYVEAQDHLETKMALYKESGDRVGVGFTHIQIGDLQKDSGSYETALFHYQESYRIFKETDDVHSLALSIFNLGDMAEIYGYPKEAESLYLESLEGFEGSGHLWGLPLVLDNLGYLACKQKEIEKSKQYFKRGLEISMSNRAIPFALNMLAGVARLLQEMEEPERAVEVLTFVANHPATERQTCQRRVDGLMAFLKFNMSEDMFNAARERGKLLDIDTVAKTVL